MYLRYLIKIKIRIEIIIHNTVKLLLITIIVYI